MIKTYSDEWRNSAARAIVYRQVAGSSPVLSADFSTEINTPIFKRDFQTSKTAPHDTQDNTSVSAVGRPSLGAAQRAEVQARSPIRHARFDVARWQQIV